jgi:hypothetical protein
MKPSVEAADAEVVERALRSYLGRRALGVDAVVSDDRHLLDVASSELQVLTPRELADRLGLASAG